MPMSDERIPDPAVTGPAQYALLAQAVRRITSPSNKTKARDLQDLVRQDVKMQDVIAWLEANPRAAWFDMTKAMRPKNVLGKPEVVSQRGDATVSPSHEEVEAERQKAWEAERKPEAIQKRSELLARLRAAGIPVENEERVK